MPVSAEPVIAIELGFSFSRVGVWLSGAIEILVDQSGNHSVPACVTLNEDGAITPCPAHHYRAEADANVIFGVKRMVGQRWSDLAAAGVVSNLPFEVRDDGNGHPVISDKRHRPEDILCAMLRNLKNIAERHLRTEVNNAVVTVPAMFGEAQRQATTEAARVAGLNVVQLLSEPIAIAIAYGMETQVTNESQHSTQKLVVVDMGRSALQVSVLSVLQGTFDVKSSEEDYTLGGDAFDRQLVDYYKAAIKENLGTDLNQNPQLSRYLRAACERAKCQLSDSSWAWVTLYLDEHGEYSDTITQDLFESLCADLFEKCSALLSRALANANMEATDVDQVLLAGRSCRIPKVRSILEDFFGSKVAPRCINLDEVVVSGATIQAALLAGENVKSTLSEGAAAPSAKSVNEVQMKVQGKYHTDKWGVAMVPALAQPVIGIEVGLASWRAGVSKSNVVDILVDKFGNRYIPASGMAEALRGDKPMTAANEKVSSDDPLVLMFEKVKCSAARQLEAVPRNVVLCVPTYFNYVQRQAVIAAAPTAGLSVVEVLNESTAIALAYGVTARDKPTLMTVSMGRHALDISIVNVVADRFEIQANKADSCLGGNEFDNRLVTHCVADIRSKLGVDLAEDAALLKYLRIACERAKKQLSSSPSALVGMAIDANQEYAAEITRDFYEVLCVDLFAQVSTRIQEVLQMANLKASDMDHVLLAGSCIRVPKIRSLFEDTFGGRLVSNGPNLDEAGVTGAAIHAALMAGNTHLAERVEPLSARTTAISETCSKRYHGNTYAQVSSHRSMNEITKAAAKWADKPEISKFELSCDRLGFWLDSNLIV
eukprot:Gregarina_sp_Pseudo_9__4611@NODE_479_length_2747_cov_149_970089_g452_i0_p1_GENE_NODE_479_length_2747_cov_149_970089_g452_i0NODE_479_length_2747_cov_149_970089_g452_i0_p1_ORF_typecomplete_len826_score183_15HSP70/PF00012_20/7_8e83HSP70/PF00012_20/6_3e62MreB_Mbl/PF06723_13/5e21MreB_Mbl/PF06723_13/1_1e15PilM_2/PF11104_8/2e06PilM_2/PF11104_8/0_0051DUF1464/PF07318_12/1_2e03DUF1464/PF07318_12/4_3DUF1464/PF07318_12/0_12SrfB/PF07520_11/0_49SrfB/PF07520_11/1_1e02SafNte_pilin/PF09460_10/92SafNte_pilin/PF09